MRKTQRRLVLALVMMILLGTSAFAIDAKEYTDLDVQKLIEMLKGYPDENPGLDLYGMAKHRTPFKMVVMPRPMNEQDYEKLKAVTAWIGGDDSFFGYYKYIIELKVPSQKPELKEFGVLRVYFQDIQYPYIVKEIQLNDTMMLFYRLATIDTANQEINLFGMDFWRPKK